MKIKQIHISNYRAFLVTGDVEAKRYVLDTPNGEHLLIYGENGSGKSSLFKALKEFFASAQNTEQTFQKNLFYDEKKNLEQPFIKVLLEDDSEHFFSAEGAKTSTHKTPIIAAANITNGFISYRDLLKLHFRHDNQEPDLFSLFFGETGFFSEIDVPAPATPKNKMSFGNLYKEAVKSDEQAFNDYNTNIESIFEDLENKANLLLAFFQKECILKIDYVPGNIQPFAPQVHFKITLFGKEVSGHHDILNEARLTAIAISVYLAHVLSTPPTDLRILFLDDIFIGLDMSNRIPLIKILTSDDLGDGTSFKDFQIFLTTYDREWFNVAKSYLGTGWNKVEFYVDNHSSSVERPMIKKSDTYKERAEFHFMNGDYPASANYLRKAFEQALRSMLPENVRYIGLGNSEVDASHIVVSKHQLTLKETDHTWFFLPKDTGGVSTSSPRAAGLHSLIDLFKTLMTDYHIPFPYIEEIIRIKNRLLNPLSHDDLRSPVFKADLESGFLIYEELLKVKSKLLIDISTINPVFLFFDQTDSKGKEYRYKFQLMENLRHIKYEETGKLLNAGCKPISRTLKLGGKEEPGKGKSQKSIYDLCRGICIHSAPTETKKDVVLEESSLLNLVLTASGQPLSTLL